jgi:two-component system KDP operon response regulator KdpE
MTETQSPPSILVVDDEPHVLHALQAALEARGYDVRTATNGSIALEAAAASRPDVVVLDIAMPGMDGVEVSRRLRSWTRIPIIVLSARTDEIDKVRALDAGADDYITKPFGTQELLARIRAAIRREQARRDEAPVLQATGLVIDLAAHRVMLHDQEVRLTPTEFALLRELAVNADRVLTHRHLLRAVFGAGYEDATANLRVFIGQLRRKIEKDQARPRFLITEPGVGYRFRLS